MKKIKRTILIFSLCSLLGMGNVWPAWAANPVETESQATETSMEDWKEEDMSDACESENGTETGESNAITESAPETETITESETEITTETELIPPETEDGMELVTEDTDVGTTDQSKTTEESENIDSADEKEAVMNRIAGSENSSFWIDTNTSEIQTFSANNSSTLPVNSSRYDKFYTPVGGGDYYTPQLAMGIKYIENDNATPDMDGKWRYVYCLNFMKSSPEGGSFTYKGGWTNRKIAYALYYGAMFWKQPCRWSGYSTGDWQLDYFVTQTSIHILNGEFSYDAAATQIDAAAGATPSEKAVVKQKISSLVNAANNPSNYTSFSEDGWFDASSQANLSLSDPSGFTSISGGYATGYSHPVFTTAYSLDLKEQITKFDISVPANVKVQKKDNKTYSDFRLFISDAQYKAWQLTGKTINATATATAPRYWGGAIYTAPTSNYQDVTMWSYTSAAGNFTKSATITKKISKKTFDLSIQKKDSESGKFLTGAQFSLWSYDGNRYNKKLGVFADKGDGSYIYRGVDYTTTSGGWFLIKEDKAPEGYAKEYVLQNSADIENFEKHGGREVKLTVDGFSFDGVPEGAVFYDKILTPKAHLVVKKMDANTKVLLSGAEFSVYEWDKSRGSYSTSAAVKLSYDNQDHLYKTVEPLIRTEKNSGKFKVVETKMPTGYQCPWSEEIEVKENGTVTLNLEALNYHVRNLTVRKTIQADEIIWAHGNPVFLFRVSGKDINGKQHVYNRSIEFTEDYVRGHIKNGYVTLETVIRNIPAGKYQVEEHGTVLRYILTDVTAQTSNITISKKAVDKVNGFTKIQAETNADLTKIDGEVTFVNHKTHYDKLSHNTLVINTIKK